jgi:hypothetical protein
MNKLNSIDELLTHIKDVQLDVMKLSSDSLMKMSSFMEKNNLEIDDNISTVLQYQDIISQQLSATIEAIDSVKEILNIEDNSELQDKLNLILQEAKDKKNRFSGNSTQDSSDDEIEFF